MNGTTEIWRIVSGYPFYSVSNLGRVRSDNPYSHKEPLIMHPYPDKDGHMKVRLCKDGAVKNFFVHRLVAAAFIDNPLGLPIVNHKDENPANNCAENLEWCTARENTVYKGMPVRRAASLRRQIAQKSMDGKVIRIWESRAAIQRQTGFSGGNITMACQGKRTSAHGYLWEYVTPEQLARYKEEWSRR